MPRQRTKKRTATRAGSGRAPACDAASGEDDSRATQAPAALHGAYPCEIKGALQAYLKLHDTAVRFERSSAQARKLHQAQGGQATGHAARYLSQERQKLVDRLSVPPDPRPLGKAAKSTGTPRGVPHDAAAAAPALAMLAALHRHEGKSLVKIHDRTFFGTVLSRPILRDGFAELLLWDDVHTAVLVRREERGAGCEGTRVRLLSRPNYQVITGCRTGI